MRKEASSSPVCSGFPIWLIGDVANHYPFSCTAVNNMTHPFIFSSSSQRGNCVERIVLVISYPFALLLCFYAWEGKEMHLADGTGGRECCI